MRFPILASGLLVVACDRPEPVPVRPAPLQVRVERVGGASATATIDTTGTVAWRREVQLGFTSAGRVARIAVDEGDRVAAGQLLAALDATTVAATLAGARAEQARARAEMSRSATLLAQGWVTQPRVDNARAALASASADVRAAGFQARTAVVTAPGAGVVLARFAEPGQVVAAGAPVLAVGEAGGGLVVRVPLTEGETNRIGLGAPAAIVFADGRRVVGRVVELPGRANATTGSFPVELGMPAGVAARAGDVARVRLTARGGTTGELLVPSAAVFAARAGVGFVYRLDPRTRRVAARRVELAETTDAAVRVTGGLAAGDLVAVSGVDRLADGMTVTPIRRPR